MTAGASTISQLVQRWSQQRPHQPAFVEAASGRTLTWQQYDRRSNTLAGTLIAQTQRGDRVTLELSSEIDMHIAMVACERAGVIGVGIGTRASERERQHLRERTGSVSTVSAFDNNETADVDLTRAFAADEFSFLNSTSGTTGLPKCVMHNQARWFAFHEYAQRYGDLCADDVCMSLLPAPFGFGLWTAHFTPTILGVPCIVMDRFDAATACEAALQHDASAIAAVSTQFMMMLNTGVFERTRPQHMRVLFTGGEMVPAVRAEQWELTTGSAVLQFYGSNETGALSATGLTDDADTRWTTAGHIIDDLQVRLFDPDTGADVTATGGPGIAACKGPVNCLGYYDDDDANKQLFTDDGWMRTGDLCTIDSRGVLTVTGRASDFIIRGGKNISAAVVEQHCATYPGVLLSAAVAKPDPLYGERICVFLACAPDARIPTLAALTEHLAMLDIGKESWPEFLVTTKGDLPRSSGGKVAKGDLRSIARDLPSDVVDHHI